MTLVPTRDINVLDGTKGVTVLPGEVVRLTHSRIDGDDNFGCFTLVCADLNGATTNEIALQIPNDDRGVYVDVRYLDTSKVQVKNLSAEFDIKLLHSRYTGGVYNLTDGESEVVEGRPFGFTWVAYDTEKETDVQVVLAFEPKPKTYSVIFTYTVTPITPEEAKAFQKKNTGLANLLTGMIGAIDSILAE